MRPLHGTKTHPLTNHALGVLRRIAGADVPASEINPGVVNRLERENLVSRVQAPSPYKSHRGGTCEHLRITDNGRERIYRTSLTSDEFEARYEKDWHWRETWHRLSVRSEPGRLQTRQERIDAKGQAANRRIAALLRAFNGVSA